MAFSSLAQALIEVGKSVKKEIFQTLKNNQDDLDSRVTTFESLAKKVVVFDASIKNASSASTLTAFYAYRIPSAMTLIDAKVVAYTIGGRTGTLEVNVRKGTSSDQSTGVSVFTTRPSLDYGTASDFDESSNTVFDNNNKDLVEGNYLFFDVTSLPSPVLGAFLIYVIAEV